MIKNIFKCLNQRKIIKTDSELKEKLDRLERNSICLTIRNNEKYRKGATRFGGRPDVPPDFLWPTFLKEGYDEEEKKEVPLSFLAQFNLEELADYDTEQLLPPKGLLSFFYELDSQSWGFSPKDKGCARVFWFEDTSSLSPLDFPSDLENEFRLPMLEIKAGKKKSYPSWADFSEIFPEDDDTDERYFDLCQELEGQDSEEYACSQLLGWPDVIQGSMFEECDLVSQGYDLGSSQARMRIPEGIRENAEKTARDRWLLLLQLDTVEQGDFELMFGDCGHIYFFIKKDDLARRCFDNIWLILQCY